MTETIAGPIPGSPGPVNLRERIEALDVLRGCALFGILLMNIVAFGLPFHAYNDPTVAGGAEGRNLTAWWATTLFFEGTMRTMFSILFGAGVILLTERAERSGASADIYLRRNLWLIVFGVFHAYVLLWFGEILYAYGIAGLVLYVFRKQPPKTLLLLAFAVFALHFGRATVTRHSHAAAFEAYQQAQAQTGEKTPEEEAAVKAWEGIVQEAKGSPEETQHMIEGYRQGYFGVLQHNAALAHMMETVFFYDYFFLDTMQAMLLGMALFRMGVLTAAKSAGFYAAMVAVGYGLGVSVNYWEGRIMVDGGFEVLAMDQAGRTYDIGRLATTAGHIGVVMLFCKSGALGFLRRALAAVGRMALTNYVMHSILCAFVFYGFGFGLYGSLERHQLYYVVFPIWAFQLIVSPLWLRSFRFGPLEWLWRSLTYGQRQPMLRDADPAPVG